jgi:hypothetical protein
MRRLCAFLGFLLPRTSLCTNCIRTSIQHRLTEKRRHACFDFLRVLLFVWIGAALLRTLDQTLVALHEMVDKILQVCRHG